MYKIVVGDNVREEGRTRMSEYERKRRDNG